MTADAVGGVWQYATDLSEALTRQGHEVVLAVLGPDASAGQRRDASEIEGLQLVETGLPLDWLVDGPRPIARAAETLAELARAKAVDLVHCNMPTLAGAADFDVPVIAVTHGCVGTWWEAARAVPLAPQFHWHRKMMAEGLAAADAVVAPSASYAEIVRHFYGLEALPLVVRNGRRRAKPLQGDGPALNAALTAGRMWDDVKNAAMLDRVAARLDIPFLAAGALRGPQGEEFMPSHLRALGQLENTEMQLLLALKPIFVSGASFEPFGLAVLEAASAGCPLVLSDIPTFRELWDGAAIFVDPEDEDGFADAIAELAENPGQREKLVRAAIERSKSFTPENSARAMANIYAGLACRRKAA